MANYFHNLSISMWQGLKTHHATLLPRFAVPAVVLYTSEGLPDPRPALNADHESAIASPKAGLSTEVTEHLYRIVPIYSYRNASEKLPSRKKLVVTCN